ncbi:MAG: GNAT family N-acetyltransferase [Proteobacteria bacterium]|nr:GNAT family N-acetyltransferase [Pseudomonadota bacterium]
MKNDSQVTVTPFENKYEDQVISLIVSIQQNEFGLPITAQDQPDLQNIQDFYQNGNGNFWIALFQGKVVGTISILDIGHTQVALRKMFVEQKHRGQKIGIADQLLDGLLGWAQLKGVREIFLGTTPKFLAAHRFYEKKGFSEIKKDFLPESFPIMKVDTKFYHFRLT